jgi:uncharacterized repeat protein (TIGR03803 family)
MKRATFIISLTTLLAGLHISSWASANKTNNGLLTKSTPQASGLVGGVNYSVLYSFQGADGQSPYAGLTYNESFYVANNTPYFYGATSQGGAYKAGSIFRISPDGTTKSVLYSFLGGNDGANPYATLTVGNNADNFYLYGTTKYGGAKNYGTIFRIDGTGHKTTLYSFLGGNDGANPVSTLVFGTDGNLYGTTLYGGSGTNCGTNGCGTVYRITTYGSTESIVYSFLGGNDGAMPYGGLMVYSDGTLYGTTEYGGGGTNCSGTSGCGTIYSITPDGSTETTLYSFQGGSDGALPLASLIYNPSGYIYGTTRNGGSMNDGTVFEIDPSSSGSITTLYSFQGSNDGSYPYSSLVLSNNGNLYGTTGYGGSHNDGTVYSIDPSGNEAVLYDFSGSDGSNPAASLTIGPDAALYGTSVMGGSHNYGALFRMTTASK